jgi:F-type H+-transporting ATPase subunit b
MNIDWFTVAAQAINFVVLLWLMRRFLYKPILNAIDEREKRIADELENAETKQNSAQKQKEEFDRKSEALNRQSDTFLKNARGEGEAERVRLLKEAREEAEKLRAERREALVAEEKALRKAVGRKTQNEVLDTTRKVLADLAGASLEEQVVGVLIRRLRDLDDAKKESLSSALQTPSGTVTVRTAFEMTPELRTITEAPIMEIVGKESKIEYESAPDLISGIELVVDGQKVAWNVADYLSSIDQGLDDLLKGQGQ